METQLSGEDAKSFVEHWVAAANNAQGTSSKICAQPLEFAILLAIEYSTMTS